jgi:1A family penicillin-binding protein
MLNIRTKKFGFDRPRRGRTRRASLGRRIALTVAVCFGALILAGTVGFIAVVAWVSRDLPDPNNLKLRALPQTTRIYDRTGEHILYEMHGDEKRTVVELSDISEYAIDASIAIEDKDFWKHGGFDIKGYLRAFLTNLARGGRSQGGSTITQQFIKNSVLTREKTYTRKLKELVLSIEMERRFSKEQILKLYLNEIPYGSVVYGIESAAQTFFGKSAKDLTLSEAAVLAALPQSPTRLSPYGSHRDELVKRAHYIIEAMLEQGMITQEEADEAEADDVLSRIKEQRATIAAPHFVFWVRNELAELLGDSTLESGGLKVITTLDWDLQEAAEKAVADGMEAVELAGGTTAALLSIDATKGEVTAMVGSPDYFNDENNGKFNSLLGLLQPGSSIKPMVYAAGFEKGYTPDTVLYDVKTNFDHTEKPYSPNDYDGKERGPVTAREALAGSLNIPAVKMLYLVGVDDFLDFAAKLGYTTFSDRSRLGLSLTLGGGEVHPIEHIAAFAAFAREGRWREPKGILKVEDGTGKILVDESEPTKEKDVLSEQAARQVNAIMSDNFARSFIFGESNWLTLGDRPVAAKSGTTNDWKDAWTVGYTPSLVAGVWTGRHDGQKMKQGSDGSKIAAPIWNAFMKAALSGKPFEQFTAPDAVTTGKPVLDGRKDAAFDVNIDRATGKLATEYTPSDYIEVKQYSQPHSILFYCSKDDPRGSQPTNPQDDPQYELWEAGVAAWAEKNSIETNPPPTEKDDVHLPENNPTVTLNWPNDGSVLNSRQFQSSVSSYAKRGVAKVEYLMDGESVGISTSFPFGAYLTIPNRFSKGFHTFVAKACDDVGNCATSAAATVNLTADAGPLGMTWLIPTSGQTLYASQFPTEVRITLDDPKSISSLTVTAIGQDGQGNYDIGVINDPPLPTISLSWAEKPSSGRYLIQAQATLKGGDIRYENIQVNVW